MHFLPTLRFGLGNHWTLLVLYGAALILTVSGLPKEKREWLFEDPKVSLRGFKKVVLRLGQLLAVLLIVAIGLSPLLQAPIWLAALGLALFAAGTALMAVSVYYFGRSAEDMPTTNGPYRFSRNPQWLGLFFALLGLAISCGSWLLVLAVLAVAACYHIQIIEEERLCRVRYGRPYEEYSRAVPRYLLIF